MGQRCEFADLEGSYLPPKLLATAHTPLPLLCGVLVVAVLAIVLQTHWQNRKKWVFAAYINYQYILLYKNMLQYNSQYISKLIAKKLQNKKS